MDIKRVQWPLQPGLAEWNVLWLLNVTQRKRTGLSQQDCHSRIACIFRPAQPAVSRAVLTFPFLSGQKQRNVDGPCAPPATSALPSSQPSPAHAEPRSMSCPNRARMTSTRNGCNHATLPSTCLHNIFHLLQNNTPLQPGGIQISNLSNYNITKSLQGALPHS